MAHVSREERRRERVTITLRADILRALREVAAEEEMDLSHLIETILAFNFRLSAIIQNADSVIRLPSKVRKRLQGREQ